MAGIVIQDLTKVYGDSAETRSAPPRAALDGLNLDVSAGELLVVVGPSGSGKTTLLRLVAGLERPTAGRVLLAGRDLTGVPPQARNVALVFQSLALYEHLTVEQNLAFPLNAQTWGGWCSSLVNRSAATSEVRARIVETAQRLRIEHLLDRRPSELSGGEQQRVALGRAIVRQPQALLLDEPLSSLDLPTRRTLRRELKALQQTLGVPTIYVTHDQAEALAIGDRVAVLDRGRLAQVGTPSEIYERPKSRFVAEFFGPMGMNLLEGELTDSGFEISDSEGTLTTIRLPADCWPQDGLMDGRVFVGIRPEDIEVASSHLPDTTCSGILQSIENCGESNYLHLRITPSTTNTRTTNNTAANIIVRQLKPALHVPAPGDTVCLRFRTDRLHWFATDSGMSLVRCDH
ncbi:MAG: ABC transporter ATP-binding protein [Pirellulaceae bacterium]|nr:ABC transporter ATP-binding protein [Pirellulaceae bacterium]